MRFVPSSVNRPDVNNLFPRRIRKASPRKAEQAKHNQEYSKCLVHGGLLLLRLAYFSKTFSISPTFFWIFPAAFSTCPLAARSEFFVICPTFSLALPFTS